MGVRQFRLGYKHGLEGIRALSHRKCRRYDSTSANEGYLFGYSKGLRERFEQNKKVGLDYSKPLNNQNFTHGWRKTCK